MEARYFPSLVVDNDTHFLSEIKARSGGYIVPTVIASDSKEALRLVADPNQKFSGVFINPEATAGRSVSLLKTIRERHPALPVFVLYDGQQAPFSAGELRRMAVHGMFKKPMAFDEMLKSLDPIYLPEVTQLIPREATLIQGMPPSDTEFVAVGVDEFLTGVTSFFDVYVRLESGRYLKVLRSGSSFTEDRLKSYVVKGLTHLYIKKSVIERCLGYCDVLANTLPVTEGVAESLKIAHVLGQGEVLLDYLRAKKTLDEQDIDEVIDYTVDVHEMVRRLNLKGDEAIHQYLKNTSLFDHAVGTTVMSLLVAKGLGMKASQIIDTVGVAGFLHDVGLFDMPESLQNEDESKMSVEEKALYKTHPERGSILLSKIENVSAAAVQAVLQHHERRDGKGFPKGKVKDGVHKVAEIVGISSACVRLLQNERIRNLDTMVERMEQSVFNGYTYAVVESFLKIFGKKAPGES